MHQMKEAYVEQRQGIEEVNAAMLQIDATAHNSMAIVQRTVGDAQMLSSEAHDMRDYAHRFTLHDWAEEYAVVEDAAAVNKNARYKEESHMQSIVLHTSSMDESASCIAADQASRQHGRDSRKSLCS